nr:unnamed protein product [Callosobruchus chinensis]
MAAVAEMGEVDEVHLKDEGSIVTNGDLPNDIDMEAHDSQDSMKKSNSVDPMDVDDIEIPETKESQEVASTTEDSTEENDAIAEENENTGEEDVNTGEENENAAEENENSVTTENPSELNEDESSQETKASEQEGSSEVEKSKVNQGDDSDKEKDDDDSEQEEQHSDSDKEKDQNESDKEEEEEIIGNKDSEDRLTDKNTDRLDEDSDKLNENIEDSNHKIESIDADDEIHEIESDDDDDDGHKMEEDPIELNDSCGEDDGDVMIVDTPKENGTEAVEAATTPEKKKQKQPAQVITPRRSSRNLNKNKSYVESDKEDEPSPVPSPPQISEESDIEEVMPEDPLADSVTIEKIPIEKSRQPSSGKTSTIVVKDTKRLVEIASKSNNVTTEKNKPTLVIIDTNSILSGRGPVPVNNNARTQSQPPPLTSAAGYQTMLPMALPAQGMYPPNMRATITPIPLNTSSITTPPSKSSPASITPANPSLTTPLLPTLTDDMFVVEAPSFIVPYVYEKPPVKDFKNFVKEMKEDLEKIKKEQEDKRKQEKKAKKAKKERKDEEADESDDEDRDSKKGSDEEDSSDESKRQKDESKKDSAEKPYSYFESPLGKFFINIGFNLVQEYVQTDLLKQQKRKANREGGANPETEKTIKSLMKNLEFSKKDNEPFKTDMKKCDYCSYKTESALVMSYHLETPHMRSFVYKCNFCPYEVRSPHDILFHMEAEHAVRGHLERAPAFHQCPNCPFEDNQKGKLSRHLVACVRKFRPDRNLEPPVDWEPPAKIPRVPKMRQQGLNATATAYQALSKNNQYQFLSKMNVQASQQVLQRGRGRPTLGTPNILKPQTTIIRPQGMVFKQQGMTGGSVLVPTSYQLGNQVFQVVGGQDISGRLGNPGPMFLPNLPSASSTMALQAAQAHLKKPTATPQQTPSISITPLPRGTSASTVGGAAGGPASGTQTAKPGDTSSKNTFVICEICDGYIKDLEQLRNHMQWIHKIKIHPKMIYNRPPLNCQKCQFRFFTDQGLERHLLGSHGLVTSSMQDAANKSKDSGRCPVCGRLLNHVARDHNMTLKPAHLSYKCTVCTATFGMYKQFENHVYSAHSVVAKRVMDKKGGTASPSSKTDQMKPLKINDEITIIPQPTKSANGTKEEGKGGASTSKSR